MRFTKLFCLAGLIFSLSGLTVAQTTTTNPEESPTLVKDEKEIARLELEKKAFDALEKIVAEAEFLKLPENRVFVLAIVADSLWTKDEKRARSLFAAAAENIVAATAELETDSSGVPSKWYQVNETRNNLLQKVATRDAELALDLLTQTRPAFLSPTFVAERDGVISKKSSAQNNQAWLVQQEVMLEQQFAVQAARNNPQRGLELARKSLAKGVSYYALNFVETLKTKDLTAANSFADEVLQRLVATDFTIDYNAPNIAQQLLTTQNSQPSQNLSQPQQPAETIVPQIRYDAGKLNQLAAKIADYYLRPNQTDFYSIQNILPLVEKFAPANAARLRRRQNELKAVAPPEQEEWKKYSEFVGKATPEQMIAAADEYSFDQKQQLYQTAAYKFIADNKPERAVAALNLLPAGLVRDEAFNNLLQQQLSNATSAEKFVEARQIAARAIGKSKQFNFLAQLAIQAAPKDKKAALEFADEARSLINEQPETSQEMRDFLQLANSYAAIEPNKSFDLLESIAPRVNEIIAASVIVLKFNQNDGGQGFRENEFALQSGMNTSVLSFDWKQHLRLLAAADFDRTQNLADKFERAEARLLFRLTLVQSVLEGRTNLSEQRTRSLNTISFLPGRKN